MRAALVMVGVLAATSGARADALSDFEAAWPAVATTMRNTGFEAELRLGMTVCRIWDDKLVQPPITDRTPAARSPDGKQLALAVTLQLSAARQQTLGITAVEPHFGEYGPVTIVLDGISGAVWAVPATTFRNCDEGEFQFQWAGDRLMVADDYGERARVSILDLAARKEAFAGYVQYFDVTTDLAHVAWTGAYSDRMNHNADSDEDEYYDDDFYVDEQPLFGTAKGSQVWSVRWASPTRLEYCAAHAKLRPTRYVATPDRRGKWIAKKSGRCPPQDESGGDGDE